MPDIKETVVAAVREAFKGHKPKPLDLAIREEDVREESGVWQVPVTPRVSPVSLYDLYDEFAKIEIDLEDNRKMKVLLLPAFR